MVRKQRRLFFQIVTAIILCSILITVLVSTIILNNSMYNVTQEAQEKFQYLASDYGHQIDIRIASTEATITELGNAIFNNLNWDLYTADEELRLETNQTIHRTLVRSASQYEYVYDYFVLLKIPEETIYLSSVDSEDAESLAPLLENTSVKEEKRGTWLNFNADSRLFQYVQPLYIDNTFYGYIGGRFRQNSFLWGIYDSEQIYWTDAWLADPNDQTIIMNHNLQGAPLVFNPEILAPTKSQSKGIFELKNSENQVLLVAFSHLKNRWRVLVGIEKKRILKRSRELISMLIMLVIIGSIFSVFIASSVSERIVEPIVSIMNEVHRISHGDLQEPISQEYMDYENEIGTLAISIENMRINIQENILEIESHAQNLENEVFYQTAELMSANDQLQEIIHKMQVKDQELTSTNEELEQTLENLKETQTELVKSQKLAALSSLVRGISHKLNTPVGTSITTLSYMIQELRTFFIKVNESCDESKAFHEDMYDLVDTANLTMTNLIKARDILDTLKDITSDSMTEHKHHFNLSRLVEELVSASRLRKEYKNHIIHLDTEKDIWIESYPSVFTQVLSHLISNSVIHGFKQLKSGRIDIQMHQLETYVEIEYKDNGSGIPDDAIDKIFDPFYTTNLSTETSGLGLSVIYNQINLKLNGSIVCDAFFKEGTRFKIRVPLN